MAKDLTHNLDLDPEQLHFIPLGGSEQFGVNLNLYAHAGKWLAVDCGIGFADHRFPGVDILLPDVSFLAERRKDLTALVVTHAHEDHVGAVAHLWPRLKCPIYCTEFTATILRRKFSEAPHSADAPIHIVKPGDAVEVGPYTLHFIHVAHSIPGTCSVVIETEAGRVLHSGDWNLDPRPVINDVTDAESFKAFGKKGIMAYIGDSTNAEIDGRAGSESDVEEGLAKLFGECKGRIAITIFASNIGRTCSVAKAAQANGRRVALIGRSLHTMTGAARDCGYLDDIAPFINEDELDDFSDDEIVLLVTGSQGEARAALARIARGEHRNVKLGRGDTVIFSSRAIPGNEADINVVKNNLVAGGCTVITPYDTPHKIHVSGHPCRDEIADMYQWLRPGLVVPVHGEKTQLEAHGAFARKCQIENVIVPNNGSVIKLGPDKPEIIDHIPTGLLAVEPRRIIDAGHQAISERRKLQYSGTVHVSIVLNSRGELLADPQLTTTGLLDTEEPAEQRIERSIVEEIEDILSDMTKDDLNDEGFVSEEIRIGVRRFVQNVLGLKPITSVHVARV